MIRRRAALQRCDRCRHVYDDRDPDDSLPDPVYRCGYTVPFWVPLPIRDYGSWVNAVDGAKCVAFVRRTKR